MVQGQRTDCNRAPDLQLQRGQIITSGLRNKYKYILGIDYRCSIVVK